MQNPLHTHTHLGWLKIYLKKPCNFTIFKKYLSLVQFIFPISHILQKIYININYKFYKISGRYFEDSWKQEVLLGRQGLIHRLHVVWPPHPVPLHPDGLPAEGPRGRALPEHPRLRPTHERRVLARLE